ncbi:hypothetical protein OG455_12470 [Kitasatospora sp. NBC_01287]|uniref:hypothetical protein n=1 Tax=Kitasatospora sp. NBC_01287 TaxID=2903573 RepID=UPI0022516213|nr:hypothetical protein [Kitasatospora sp. NBC_01287]MCX4746331.1 hypothetical protein [Kitasatospora sp. NBC_01287]
MQHHLLQRLNTRAAERWPQLARVHVRLRAGFAYVEGELKDGERLPPGRLRFAGVLHTWGFAGFLAGRGGYEDNVLPSGLPVGAPEECLDCACGLYLDSPAA